MSSLLAMSSGKSQSDTLDLFKSINKAKAKMKPPVADDVQTVKAKTVSEVNREIKSVLEGHFKVSFWVEGEVSNFTAHSSGHFYFSLKDQRSQIQAVMFRGHNARLKFKPKNGMKVLAKARVSAYEPRGSYQLYCEWMEPAGVGALQVAFEQLKAKLQSEGLFAQDRKKPIPAFPQKIAIVTSPTGAAIRDMIHVLQRRYPSVHVLLIPCVVQGQGAAPDIVRALSLADQTQSDVIIFGRGGGSKEDLWAFNEEVVARKIAELKTPSISAVGHEIDFTIGDFVADLRAPTPSAAAEVVAKNSKEVLETVKVQLKRMQLSLANLIRRQKEQVYQSNRQLTRTTVDMLGAHKKEVLNLNKRLVDPQKNLDQQRIRTDEWMDRLTQAMQFYYSNKKHQVLNLSQKLVNPKDKIQRLNDQVLYFEKQLLNATDYQLKSQSQNLKSLMVQLDQISPLKTVDRGYAIVADEKKQIISSTKKIKINSNYKVQLKDGVVEVKALRVDKESLWNLKKN
ncbi:MAG: exodeoxyribonuclease VII large subunit [Bdellovibrionales bacterium]|nr:exodeoxyribonuclease VII large subunit [Bdellovibrionales bacterium]